MEGIGWVMTTACTPLEAALSYAALGWPVVPLHTPIVGVCDCPKRSACTDAGKHPRTIRGLDDSTTDEAKIRLWWGPKMWPQANIAVDLKRAGLVDIAPDSIEWHAQFIARGLPRTVSFRSGGGDGHEHHLYQRPEDCPPHRICIPDQYDVLSNGYAVMPPSLHASGQNYTWLESPAAQATVTAPSWSVDMLTEANRHTVTTNGVAHIDEDEPPVRLVGEALERWTGTAVSLKLDGTVNRSLSLVMIAQALAAAGATRSTIAHALQNRDEVLGWSKYVGRRDASRRYGIIADSAFNGRGPARLLRSADRLQPRVDVVPHTVWAKPISALLNQPERPIDWLIDQLFSVGASGFIAAEPKVGKSWIALELSYCLATAMPFLGRFAVPSERRVFFIEEEDPERRMLRRFNRLLRGVTGRSRPSDSNFHYVCRSGFRLDDAVWMATLRAELDSFRPDVVVLDVFNKLHLKDENSQAEISAILHELGALTRAYGAAFLIVHHYRKSGGVGQSARGNQMLRGTSVLSGYAECSLYLRKGKGKGVIICEPESKDAPELEAFEIRLEDTDDNGSRLVASETSTRVREAEEEQAALETVDRLEHEGKDVIADSVAVLCEWDRTKASRVLNRLVAMGRLDSETVQVGRKGYRMYHNPELAA